MKQYIQAELKKGDDGKITFIASDETLDRSGEVIPVDSWDLSNYTKNPVLLVNHDYKVENIVGKARNVRREKGKLLFEPVFHSITQLAREVKEMVEQGILNTVSVGFMPHGPQKDGDRGTNELFEISFVPVPANPSAERLSAAVAKSAEDLIHSKEIEEWVIKKAIKEGRVLSGKNRKLINEAVETLKTATAALGNLLEATETNVGEAGVDNIQGREPKVVYVQTEKEVTPIPSAVIRALQSVNRITNDSLRKIKK